MVENIVIMFMYCEYSNYKIDVEKVCDCVEGSVKIKCCKYKYFFYFL